MFKGGTLILPDSSPPAASPVPRRRPPRADFLVVDQNSSEDTRAALARLLADRCIRCIHSATVGVGLSHNLGLRAAKGDMAAFTDDDSG